MKIVYEKDEYGYCVFIETNDNRTLIGHVNKENRTWKFYALSEPVRYFEHRGKWLHIPDPPPRSNAFRSLRRSSLKLVKNAIERSAWAALFPLAEEKA